MSEKLGAAIQARHTEEERGGRDEDDERVSKVCDVELVCCHQYLSYGEENGKGGWN